MTKDEPHLIHLPKHISPKNFLDHQNGAPFTSYRKKRLHIGKKLVNKSEDEALLLEEFMERLNSPLAKQASKSRAAAAGIGFHKSTQSITPINEQSEERVPKNRKRINSVQNNSPAFLACLKARKLTVANGELPGARAERRFTDVTHL